MTTATEPIADNEVEVIFVEDYRELFNENWRTIVYYGGRNSGKSRQVGLALLLRGRKRRLRILCTREIQNTIKDSVHKLLKDLIEQYSFSEYVVTDNSIINALTGTEFIFRGVRHNVEEIKSTEGIDICWIEEAHKTTDSSLDIIGPTIRKPGSQIIITYNRVNELDPVHVRYVINRPPNTYVAKVNYDALERAGLLSDVIRVEIEHDRKTNPGLYAHKWLGEPLAQNDLAIINREAVLEAMEREVPAEGATIIGVDVARMGNDRSVFWKRKGLKTTGTQIHSKLRIPELADRLELFASYSKDTELRIDDTGVGGGLTDEMMKRGYNVVAVNFGGIPGDKDKYPNWISEAWFHMAEVLPEAQIPMDSDLIMELTTRQWRQDNKGKRAVESKNDYKKRGFRSPDLADACIICYSNPEHAAPGIVRMSFV